MFLNTEKFADACEDQEPESDSDKSFFMVDNGETSTQDSKVVSNNSINTLNDVWVL